MGYSKWGTRTPLQVQIDNQNRLSFDKVKEIYENTKPIQGKRASLNIRPLGDRGRSHERVFKVSDTEYYVSANSYAWVQSKTKDVFENHCRAITFSKRYDTETIVIHTPKTNNHQLMPRWLDTPSMLWFYHYKMPHEFSMHNHRGKKYLAHTVNEKTKYYTMAKGDLVFSKQPDKPNFSPLQVHREIVRELDKEQTKELRKNIKPFVDYANTMIDLIETDKYHSGNPLDDIPIDILFKHDADQVWFELVEKYKRMIKNEYYNFGRHTIEYNKKSLNKYIYNHLYRKVKPFKLVEVPIGELVYDKYRSWE
jgi:hypothetical protein